MTNLARKENLSSHELLIREAIYEVLQESTEQELEEIFGSGIGSKIKGMASKVKDKLAGKNLNPAQFIPGTQANVQRAVKKADAADAQQKDLSKVTTVVRSALSSKVVKDALGKIQGAFAGEKNSTRQAAIVAVVLRMLGVPADFVQKERSKLMQIMQADEKALSGAMAGGAKADARTVSGVRTGDNLAAVGAAGLAPTTRLREDNLEEVIREMIMQELLGNSK